MSENDNNPNDAAEPVDPAAEQPAAEQPVAEQSAAEQPVAAPQPAAAVPPPPAGPFAPAAAQPRWRDRVFRMRAVAAVAVAGVILGAAGGAVTTALVSDRHDDRGRHEIGQQFGPGVPMMPGMPPGGRMRFGDGSEDGQLPEMPVPPGYEDGTDGDTDGGADDGTGDGSGDPSSLSQG